MWTTQAETPSPLIGDNTKPVTYTAEQRDLAILNWQKSKEKLTAAKEAEVEQRKAIVAMLFNDPKSGVNHYDLGQGYKLTYTHKLEYKLDQEKVQDALDKIEAQGPVGEYIADNLVKFKADLSLTEYKKLGPVDKKLIDEVLTITPAATPTLELKEPKEQ